MTIPNPRRSCDRSGAAEEMTVEQVPSDRSPSSERRISFDQPGDSVELWRYMDLGKFLSMIRGQCLYFARLREFSEDSLEGVHPGAQAVYPNLDREGLKRLYDANRRYAAVSCWHEGADESVAMWRLYTTGAEGVAVKTTVSALKRSLEPNEFALRVARVQYIGDSQYPIPRPDLMPDGLDSVFCKRLVYQHEREVRATLIPVRSPEGPLVEPDLSRGLTMRVDLARLLERVVIAERFPKCAVPVVEDALRGVGVSIPVELSAVKRGPLDR